MARSFPIQSYEEWCKYTDLVRAVEKRKINPNDIFVQTAQKRQMLKKIIGYKSLKGEKIEESLRGEKARIPIEKCEDERIGKVFRKEYNAAVERLKKQRLLEFYASCAENGEEISVGGKRYIVSYHQRDVQARLFE